MHELIDLAKFELIVKLLAGAALPAGLVVGALLGRARRQMRGYLIRGAALGLLGPILYALWRYYRWMVRLDPATGYVGLHKPSVRFINVAAFAAFGVVLGLVYGRIFSGGGESAEDR